MYDRYCQLRNEKGYKDADIAKAIGITPSTFSDWKKEKSTPNLDKVCKLAKFFNVSLDYFVNGNSPPTYQITDFEYRLILAYRQAGALQEAVNKLLNIEQIKKEAYFTA